MRQVKFPEESMKSSAACCVLVYRDAVGSRDGQIRMGQSNSSKKKMLSVPAAGDWGSRRIDDRGSVSLGESGAFLGATVSLLRILPSLPQAETKD